MSLRLFAGVTAMFCGLSLAVAAQAPPHASPGRRDRRGCAPTSRAASAARPPVRQGKDVNIRIDATVVESRGTQVVDKKVISLTCVDGEWVVRSSQQVPFKAKGSEASPTATRRSTWTRL